MIRRAAAVFLFVALFTAPAFAYRITAWIAPWDQASLTSVQLNAGSMSESNPVWYSMDASGRIVPNWNAENPTWRAAMTGTELLPTVQNVVNGAFNASVAEGLLATAASREAHAEEIRQLVVSKAFDGIDIDYERVPTTSRANFTAFVELLAAKLHGSAKKLSVTVYAKTSDAQNWNGPGSQDWPLIGAAADSVKIMAYDYHWSTSAAGPLTPLDWLDGVAAYAVSAIPPAKVIVGLPWYGYDWQGTSGQAVTYASAKSIAANNNATVGHDLNGEAMFTYADHTVYFQDASSYSRKVDLLRTKYASIGGFAHWRSGTEDAEVWNVIRNVNGAPAGAAPAPAPDFSVSGPSSLPVMAGKTASGSYAVSGTNGFSSAVNVTVASAAGFPGTLALSATAVAPGGSVRLSAATSKSAAAGDYAVVLRFTGGGIAREQNVTVTVSRRR